MLVAIQAVSMGAMEMSGPFWPLLLRPWIASDHWFSLAVTAVYVGPMLGLMLAGPLWGALGDRHGHKAMMIRALLGLSLTQWMIAAADGAVAVVLCRFLQGLLAGFIVPAQAYGVAHVSASGRVRLFAALQAATNVGALVGAVAGGLLLDQAAFFWVNLTAGLLCAACAVCVARCLPPDSTQPPAGEGTAVSAAQPEDVRGGAAAETAVALAERQDAAGQAHAAGGWMQRGFWMCCALLGVFLFARMLPQTVFARYVSDVLKADHAQAGLCYGLMCLGFVLAARRWAAVSEQADTSKVLKRVAQALAGCLGAALLAVLASGIWGFALAYLLWGAALAGTQPLVTALASRLAPAGSQGMALSLVQSTVQLSAMAGIATGAWLGQVAGLHRVYEAVLLAYVVACWMAWRMSRLSGR